jgi:hypothetical protein
MNDPDVIFMIAKLFDHLMKQNADEHLDGEQQMVVSGITLSVYIRGLEIAFCPIRVEEK